LQILYKIVSDSSGYVSLFDESKGDTLEADRGSFKGLVQKESLAFGASQFRAPRGNVSGSLALRWTSTYADSATARNSIATMNMLKLSLLHLKIVDGSVTLYAPNAISESYEYDHQGRGVTHSLTFECDDLTTTQPV